MVDNTAEKLRAEILADALVAMKNRGKKSADEICAEIVQKNGGNAADAERACKAIDHSRAELAKIKARGKVSRFSYLKNRLLEITGSKELVSKIVEKIYGFSKSILEKLGLAPEEK